jgi:hypothetical protein
MNRPLYILFVREQPALNLDDFRRQWRDDHEACDVFEQAKMKGGEHPILPCYEVSDSAATTIVEIATNGRQRTCRTGFKLSVPNYTNKLLLELASMRLALSAMTTWSTPVLKLSMKIKRRAEDLKIHARTN